MTQGLWTRETVAILTIASLIPLAGFWLWLGGIDALNRLIAIVLIIAIWQLVFMMSRAQPPSLSLLVTAFAIAVLAPEDLGSIQLTLGVSFGVVLGELVFGGWGRNVVNPATVAVAFLGFGFPAAEWPTFHIPIAWAALPALLLGLVFGVTPLALALVSMVFCSAASLAGLISDPVFFAALIALVLIVLEPVTSAATTFGRAGQGALYAALVILFGNAWLGAAPPQIAVSAALLSSLAAPLLDSMAISLWVYRRRRRHGRT